MFSMNFDRGRNRLALATVVVLGLALPAQAQLFQFPSNEAAPQAAQGDSAQLLVRIQQLEEQLRTINGQVEGLTFQLTQMQELLTRTTQAYEARLQAIEGGGTPSAGTTQLQQAPAQVPSAPATEIPPQGVQPLPGETEFDPTFDDGSQPAGDMGSSADPLVGTGAAGGVDLSTGQPLDLGLPAADTGDADADAQFAAGADALASGDYAFAEDQFTQFLSLYPDNPMAPDAASLLGDALLHRAAYNEAADVLLKAYQASPDSPQAPELLLKLGVSMAGVGEREVACRTFAQVETSFGALRTEVSTRLAAEKTNAECPPA
ncbi:MAG: hypothetical protein JWP99_853 [Devosia sp.]|nr:hypothetical protein [Devosia sp.]